MSRLRRLVRAQLALLPVFTAVGLAQALAVRAALTAEESTLEGYVPFVWHLTGALAAWAALPIVYAATRLAPSPPTAGSLRRWARLTAVHALGYVTFSIVHVAGMLALRALSGLWSLRLPARALSFDVLYEAQHDLVVYGAIAAVLALLAARRARTRAALRTAQLEARLTEARLDALTASVSPHFLYNALNTVSALMYEDLERTDRVITSLGDLLRASLEPGLPTWTLGEERGHVARYVEILGARFGDRLAISWPSERGNDHVMVPRFCVQELIQNAIKHNAQGESPLTIHVADSARDGRLSIEVEDDGRGSARVEPRATGGLARLSSCLELLYGELGRLTIARTARGARVQLLVPCSAVA
jgi:signal transduction histidine kinase